MEDKLEKFVRDNRNELDGYEPRERLWTNIGQTLAQRKRKKRVYLVAASVALLAACGAWFLWPSQQQDTKPEIAANHKIQQTEIYYASLITEKRKELHSYCKEQKELCVAFEQDMRTLDSLYLQLKSEYPASPDKEMLLQAMMDNLRLQLEILGRQLQVIKNIKQKQSVVNSNT